MVHLSVILHWKLQDLPQVCLLLLLRALMQQGHRQEVWSFIPYFDQSLREPVGDCSGRAGTKMTVHTLLLQMCFT